MRIIGGKFKGKNLFLPKDNQTRPLRDMVKESIINIIHHSNIFDLKIENSKVLDLFSGSGSFGLECLSQGAKEIFFLENHIEALKILKKNVTHLKSTKKCNIVEKNCFDFFKEERDFLTKFDIIFIDPPYKEIRINELLESILKKKKLKKGGLIIIHRHKKDSIEITSKIKILDIRLYGISKIIFGS